MSWRCRHTIVSVAASESVTRELTGSPSRSAAAAGHSFSTSSGERKKSRPVEVAPSASRIQVSQNALLDRGGSSLIGTSSCNARRCPHAAST